MKFHRRVPSFSFTTFTFSNNNNNNNPSSTTTTTTDSQQPLNTNSTPASHRRPSKDKDNNLHPTNHKLKSHSRSHSQPSSPTHFDLSHLDPQPPASSIPSFPSDPNHSIFTHQQQQQPPPPSPSPPPPSSISRVRDRSITLLLSPDDPLKFIVDQSSSASNRRNRSGSLVERPSSSLLSPLTDHYSASSFGRRRASLTDSAHPPSDSSLSPYINRHRKRFSNLFGPLSSYYATSRSPSPASRHSRHRFSNLSSDPNESDRESTIDSHSTQTQIDLPSSDSDDESDSNHSTSDRSTEFEPDPSDSDDEHTQTILANTTANASSITPIDFLQKSNQPIPFIDQAPNLTSPPPFPISFVPTDPRFPSATVMNSGLNRKPSLASRSSIRRRSSIKGSRHNLELTVSRPIYQKNRCTITIEHGNWSEAAKKAERTRFYLVACDLSDESKYAIEWTIGTVLRQGDECLIIMIIETDSKFDPEDGVGSAADRAAKIRNQKDRQEKATMLVREATALLERTGLNCKVTCQAIHGKNPKHMLIDCIDYLEPNLVIVGRRGMTSSKNSLMGSVSHHLLHKSSVPVMVARRRLRTLPKVYKKKAGIVPKSPIKLTEASIDKQLSSNSLAPAPENKRLSVVNEETELKNQLRQLSLSDDNGNAPSEDTPARSDVAGEELNRPQDGNPLVYKDGTNSNGSYGKEDASDETTTEESLDQKNGLDISPAPSRTVELVE